MDKHTAENDAEALAAELGEHRICWRTLRVATCTCGKWARPDEKGGSLRAPVRREHDAHVAEALLPLLTPPGEGNPDV